MTLHNLSANYIQVQEVSDVLVQYCWHVTKTEPFPSCFALAAVLKERTSSFSVLCPDRIRVSAQTCLLNQMACFSHQLVSLLVVLAYLLWSESVRTHVEGQSLRQRSRLGDLFRGTSPPSNIACFRLCRSMVKEQEKRRVGKQVKPAFKCIKSE